MPRYLTDFARVSKCPFSLILDNVKFSLLMGLKSNNFVFDSFRESLFALSQSVTNFSSLRMTLDITEGFLCHIIDYHCLQNDERLIFLQH